MRLRRSFIDLTEAVIVITGASSGIGRATAHRLARRGSSLVLASRSADALADTATECVDEGGDATTVVTDLAEPRDIERLAAIAEERFGRIDAWVNNAGVMAYGRMDDVPIDVHRRVIETNLVASMHGASESLRRFRSRDGPGMVVNVASLYGEMTTPYVSSYATSKFGLLGFSRALRRDLRPDPDLRVCCVLPSSVDTPIFRVAGNHHGWRTRAIPPVVRPERVARAIERCLRRPRPEVRVGCLGRVAALGERFLAPVYDRVIHRVFDTVGFTRERVAPHDGNLFAPEEDWNRVHGDWRRTATRRVAAAGFLVLGAAVVVGGRARQLSGTRGRR